MKSLKAQHSILADTHELGIKYHKENAEEIGKNEIQKMIHLSILLMRLELISFSFSEGDWKTGEVQKEQGWGKARQIG